MPIPADFATRTLKWKHVNAAELMRIYKTPSGYHPLPVYYGKKGVYRFDCPAVGTGYNFGVLYAAFDLETCFAEAITREKNYKNFQHGGIYLSKSTDIMNRSVANLKAEIELKLADLTDVGLYQLGAEAGEFHSKDYVTNTQPWALEIYRRPENVDGILYVSRFLNGRKAVAIFDRGGARTSLEVSSSKHLIDHEGYRNTLDCLSISLFP
ncbi:RES family NAD+ phosphorylase [Methylomonas sp. EFPC1]|uniref:RES family NAD+ phosphorylase n=1 Tax=Methylomonas sp. EFPC1 TaxID=2812647 RepID=UPI0019672D4B|nr:RES family NAD+ phosphorylase [Methylomonas sp. EFPC1]QSB02475.1 RES family NAD+ phosphorylase [Methylomonas sp. EFPC1]